MNAFIATPMGGAAGGNRVTALRWAKRLRELGWNVRVGAEWSDEPCDLLVALHAHKSHASVARHARSHGDVPRIVALTGTDVYGDLEHDALALESLSFATRMIVLQPRALDRLPSAARARTRVILQGAIAPRDASPLPGFTACALAHLRDVKDPLLAARAVSLLPDDAIARIVHVGAPHDASWIERARQAERETGGRWSWLGGKPRGEALRILAGAQLLVLTSRSEGGANVVTEAIAAGVPVISTRVDGSLGILGEDYPGYCAIGDAEDLARTILRCEREPSFLMELRQRVAALRPLVAPERERASWQDLLHEIGL
jgi:putative glycosyltransferase (TIGR04348 family)